jgi:thiol:disulfide interchange protein
VISWEAVKVLSRVEKTEEGESKEGNRRTKVKPSKKGGKAAPESELSVVRLAAETGKPVMFFVHGNCNGSAGVACKTMGKLVLRQKAVTDAAKAFHAVEVDATKIDPKLARRYKLKVSPSLVFVDCAGKVVTVLPGKPSAKQVAAVMKAVVARNDKVLKKRKAKKKPVS